MKPAPLICLAFLFTALARAADPGEKHAAMVMGNAAQKLRPVQWLSPQLKSPAKDNPMRAGIGAKLNLASFIVECA